MRTWIVIADAAHVRVLESKGVGKPLMPVPGLTYTSPTPRNRDLANERPTRTHDSIGNSRHAIEPKSDPRRDAKRVFAETLADKLEAATGAHAFDRLVIAAPPAMLGDLRAALPQSVAERIAVELPRNLVKVRDGDLRAHFADFVAF